MFYIYCFWTNRQKVHFLSDSSFFCPESLFFLPNLDSKVWIYPVFSEWRWAAGELQPLWAAPSPDLRRDTKAGLLIWMHSFSPVKAAQWRSAHAGVRWCGVKGLFRAPGADTLTSYKRSFMDRAIRPLHLMRHLQQFVALVRLFPFGKHADIFSFLFYLRRLH